MMGGGQCGGVRNEINGEPSVLVARSLQHNPAAQRAWISTTRA
jgi:hypothetical protein